MALPMTAYENASLNQASGYASNAKPPHNPNFYDSLGDAEGKIAGLVNRLNGIAERLCGPVPTPDASALKAVSNGLFEDAMTKAYNIQNLADAGQEALDRIERSLP